MTTRSSRPRGTPSRTARSRARSRATSRSRSTRGSRADPRRRRLGSVRVRAVAQLEDREERLLRDLDAPDLLHALLALLLAFEQLALAGDVAAVALGGDVLAERLDGLAGDDLRADGGVDRDVELLARDLRAQLLGQGAADVVGLVAVDDHAQRVHGVAREQHVELD